MKYLFIISVTILFSFYSCSPSMYQLERFELAQSIEKGYLVVNLENRSEEIMLLKKYGQHKKAERMARKDAKHNSSLKQAVSKNYNYSNVLFTYNNKHSQFTEYETLTGEKIEINSDKKLYNLSFQKSTTYQNEREQEVLTLRITSNNNSYLDPSEIITEANVSDNIYGYSLLLNKMNNKLYKLAKSARKNLAN